MARSNVLITHVEPQFAVGDTQGVLLEWTAAPPTRSQIEQGTALCGEMIRSRRRIGMVIIADGDDQLMGVPGEETRSAYLERLRAYRDGIYGIALVVRFGGFRGAAVRGLGSSISLLERRTPFKVFAQVAEALRWLSDHARAEHRSFDAATVLDAFEELRAEGLRASR